MKLPGAIAVSLHAVLCASLSILLFTGCGKTDPANHVVQGSVKFDGKPLEQGTITFYPVTANVRPARASLQSDGKFELKLIPGEYKVTVNAFQHFTPDLEPADPNYKEPKSLVPVKYSSLTRTELRHVADQQNSSLDLDLKSS